jgi:branched-chain amino acid transport system substrate-binding protein
VRYKSDDLFGDTQNFVKLFTAKYKSEPDFTQASGSCHRRHSADGDREGRHARSRQGAKRLANTEFKTFFAPVKFGPDGQANSYTPPIFQIQDKKVVVIYPT